MKTEQLIIPSAEPFLFLNGQVGCLLVHGFTGTPKEMRLMGEYLAGQGHTVLGIRLTGHATTMEDMIRTKWQDWLASVEDGICLLRANCRHIFVMGLSMGGALTLMAASRYKLDGIVVMSAPHDLSNDPRYLFLPILKFIIPKIPKGTPDWFDSNNLTDHISYSHYPTKSIHELVKFLEVMRNSLPLVKVPALFMQSRDDKTVSPNSMDYLADHISSEVVKRIRLEKSGHVITREPQKSLVFQAAGDFIDQVVSEQQS